MIYIEKLLFTLYTLIKIILHERTAAMTTITTTEKYFVLGKYFLQLTFRKIMIYILIEYLLPARLAERPWAGLFFYGG